MDALLGRLERGIGRGQGRFRVRARRLELCRRDFLDPLLAHQSVSAIAAKRGFVDASHFSRLFRATYGQAPTGFRENAKSEFRGQEQAA